MRDGSRPAPAGRGPAAITGIVVGLFPIIAVVCMHITGPALLIAGLCAALLFRLVRGGASAGQAGGTPPVVIAGVVLLLVVMAAVDPKMAVLLYPVFINAAMAIAFGATLLQPQSMIERFARLQHPGFFPDRAVRYTRNVTIVWVAFFGINGAVALWTALAGSWTLWALHNGLISYILIGSLIVGEMFLRSHLRPREIRA